MATATSLRRGIQQYQASTGRRITPEALQALLAAELDVQASRQAENKAFELRQTALEEDIKQGRERLGLDRERIGKEAQASKFSGITQLAGTALQGGMLLKDTALGKAIGGKVAGAFGIGAPAATTGATTAASFAPGTVGAEYGALGGAGYGAGAYGTTTAGGAAVGSSFAPGTLGAEYGALEGAGYTSGTFGTATVGSGTSTGAGTAAGTIGGTATGAAAGASVGRAAANWVGSGSTTEDVGTIGGGAATGAYLGTYVYPGVGTVVGGVIGAAVGGVVDFVSDAVGTVLCSEIYRQGYLPREIWYLSGKYRKEKIDDQTYAGYLRWAGPLSETMKTSKVLSLIARPFVVGWAYEMAHRMKPEIKGNFLGKLLLWTVAPLCFWLGREKKEICYGS